MEINSQTLRISAKNLGILAQPDYCPRCFYLKLKLQFKLPFQIFPGIFSSIDSFSKKITWTYYDKFKKLPPWFSDFGQYVKPMQVPHYTQFFFVDEETNVELRGVPDEVFLTKEEFYSIIDYKTSRYTDQQDKLLGMYKVQLNSYALIGERSEIFSPVGQLLLVYYEPHGGILEVEQLEEVLLEEGFNLPFSAHLMELDLNPEQIIKPLLREVRRLADREEAPKGSEFCEDCQRLGALITLVEQK